MNASQVSAHIETTMNSLLDTISDEELRAIFTSEEYQILGSITADVLGSEQLYSADSTSMTDIFIGQGSSIAQDNLIYISNSNIIDWQQIVLKKLTPRYSSAQLSDLPLAA